VLNASPIIVLARIGREDLLLTSAEQVVVPRTVAEEIQVGPLDDPARRALASGSFSLVNTPSPPAELLAWDLGAGETAVLSWALIEPGWTAILDDASARKCAHSFAIPVKGTLAIVLQAKRQGLIASAAEILRALRATGFRIDDQVVREALKRTVDEEW
jgi:predicted nucleic acid-binding protein